MNENYSPRELKNHTCTITGFWLKAKPHKLTIINSVWLQKFDPGVGFSWANQKMALILCVNYRLYDKWVVKSIHTEKAQVDWELAWGLPSVYERVRVPTGAWNFSKRQQFSKCWMMTVWVRKRTILVIFVINHISFHILQLKNKTISHIYFWTSS